MNWGFFRPWVYNLRTAYGLHVPHFTVCVSCSAGHALVLTGSQSRHTLVLVVTWFLLDEAVLTTTLLQNQNPSLKCNFIKLYSQLILLCFSPQNENKRHAIFPKRALTNDGPKIQNKLCTIIMKL